MMPRVDSTAVPTFAKETVGSPRKRCDRITCRPGNRCDEHRPGARPTHFSDLFAEILRGGVR